MKKQCAIILAAGKGTRMKNSDKPKVLNEVLFEPIIDLVLNACKDFDQKKTCVVVGTKADLVKDHIKNRAVFATQAQTKGTAHAVLCAKEFLENNIDYNVFICCGDSPLMDSTTIEQARQLHEQKNASATIISTELENCNGYGRIIRNENNKNLVKIVEDKDANPNERKVHEINSGAYWFNTRKLLQILNKIQNNNSNNEFYLTDAIEILLANQNNIEIFKTQNSEFCLGANTKEQLMEINEILRLKKIRDLIKNNVEILCTDGIIISQNVKIKPKTMILPGTIISKNSIIGSNCKIGPNSIIENSIIGSNCIINNSQIYESKIEDFVKIGPFCHIRPNSKILSHVKIGDFVEIKNSTLGEGTQVSHLTYVGDSDVGKNVNFGCGVVTTNFDGINKNKCEIQDGAFLGCNTNLIAPVKIGQNAYTGAGSTITKNVPDYALGIERTKQVNIKDFSKTKLAGRKLKFNQKSKNNSNEKT